jgi:hypothetical protein
MKKIPTIFGIITKKGSDAEKSRFGIFQNGFIFY